jgi:hypothetical protein
MLKKLSAQDAWKRYRQLATYENVNWDNFKKVSRQTRDFYFGKQWTAEELNALKDRGQYTLTINKVRKAIKGMVGLFASSLPKYKVVPAGGQDEVAAEFANKILDWVWQNSNGLNLFQGAVKKALIENISFLNCIYGSDGKVKFKRLDFDEVIVDPKSRDPLFRDAEMIIVSKYMSRDKAQELYGVDNLVTERPSDWSVQDSTSDMDVVINKVFSDDKQYVKIYESYVKRYYRTEDGFVRTRINKETMVGYDNLFVETLPEEVTEYPIVPVYVEYTGNPYPRGEVYFLRELQRFINKTYGVVLLNAQLTSNPKVFVRETDIPNMSVNKFEDNMAKPGSLNVLSGNAEDPFIVQGQPLNNAFFNLYSDAKAEFESATLPQEILGFHNSAERANQNSSYLLDVKESVIDSMRDFVSNLENACVQMGRVALQFVRGYMKDDRLLYILDGEKKYKQVKVNKKQGLDADSPESVRRYEDYLKQKGVPDEEIVKETKKIQEDSEYAKNIDYIINDTNLLDVDLYIVPGSFSPTYKMAMLRLMIELHRAGAVDSKAILEYSPIENKDEMIQRYDRLRQMEDYVKQLEEQLKEAEQTLKSREEQLVSSRIDTRVSREELRLKKMQAEAKLKTLRDKYENKLMTKKNIMQLQQEMSKILTEEKINSAQRQAQGQGLTPSDRTQIDDMIESL